MTRTVLHIVLFSIILLSSCSMNEIDLDSQYGTAIDFSGYVGQAAGTKATSVNSINALASFSVNAFYTDETLWASYTPDYTEPNFMDNITVTGSGSDADRVWTYSPKKYWPVAEDKIISFFAYSPVITEGCPLSWNEAETHLKYTLATDPTDHCDFLFARLPDQTRGAVNLSFNHALSRISVATRADFSEDYSEEKGNMDNMPNVTISSVSLGNSTTGFHEDALYDLYGSTGWSSKSATLKGITFSTTDDNYAMVIPQNITSLPISITYTLTYPKTGAEVTNTTSGTITANLEAGKAYSITIDITLNGISFSINTLENWSEPEEIPIEPPKELITLGVANSYILHPSKAETHYYKLPVDDRLAQYWGPVDATTYPDGYPTEWVAEVIWQDQADRQLISFCDSKGVVNPNTSDITAAPFIYTSTGDGYLYLTLTGTSVEGNVLIGVKPAGETGYSNYLWSWHLWITDYDPDAPVTIEQGTKYIYDVPNGKVHRYDDPSGTEVASAVWGEGGAYYTKYMMDRNLGALSDVIVEDKYNAFQIGGLGYLYGRKDPFPGATSVDGTNRLYNIKGVSLYEADNNYFKSGGYDEYGGAGDKVDYIVKIDNDPTIGSADEIKQPYAIMYTRSITGDNIWGISPGGSDKGLYDPCPEGWRIPKLAAFKALSAEGFVKEDKGYGLLRGSSSTNSVVYFKVSIDGDVTVPFPLTTWRKKGLFMSDFYSLIYTDTINTLNSLFFGYYIDSVTTQYPDYTSKYDYVASVRCVKE